MWVLCEPRDTGHELALISKDGPWYCLILLPEIVHLGPMQAGTPIKCRANTANFTEFAFLSLLEE